MSRVFKQFSKIVKEMQESSFQVKVPIFNINIKIPSKIKHPQAEQHHCGDQDQAPAPQVSHSSLKLDKFLTRVTQLELEPQPIQAGQPATTLMSNH